ncbi:GIN domain-containing protein [Pedobacter duraquae]|uniref:Putative autotransporter adhesin-like protein n=1 Tax=Pedobacter duraquae TaxID=425511 RepID=A0A4R6IPC7_9SPHI|nr:DUF2807 domain-containing protein [Pedobacter duraquae]TDO24113.1 putative autotransporter adhesin-like protein [Pedobacter duraquae]
MKQPVGLFLILAIAFAGCKSKCIEDSGKHIEKKIVAKNFDKISLTGPIKLVIHQDSSYAITVSADSNVVDAIETKVSGSELTVKLDADKYCGTDSIVVHAGIGPLTQLKVKGASTIVSTGVLKLGDLKLEFSGTISANLNLQAGKVSTVSEGVTDLKLTGQAGQHELNSKGTITLGAQDFTVGIYKLNIEGLGNSKINVLNELYVETSGASEIYYRGNPKTIKENKKGAAKLEKVN